MDSLDANVVRSWLEALPGRVRYPDVAGELADWLLAGAGRRWAPPAALGRTSEEVCDSLGACQPYWPGASLVIPTQRLWTKLSRSHHGEDGHHALYQ